MQTERNNGKKQKKLTNWTKDGSTSQVALPSLVTVGVTNRDKILFLVPVQ
jgi:hypothetical protein